LPGALEKSGFSIGIALLWGLRERAFTEKVYSTIRTGAMDVNKTLRELHQEKRQLDVAIAALEARLKNGAEGRKRRRGRRSMSAAERLEVSRRMAKYWEGRRAAARELEFEPHVAAATAGESISA
jgi:hypothetical protein